MTEYRVSFSLRALLLAATAIAATPAMAADEQPTVPIAVAADPGDDEDIVTGEIVVTAPRLAGQLDTDIAAEAELDEAAIASYGVSSIEELLTAIEPQTRSGRGRGGGRPVILVNGRRIAGFHAVRHLPPEAIVKVEVFPEEVALQYGYAATERVVNFVLKPDFRQVSLEAEAGMPTEGGRFQSEVEPSFVAIGKNGRVNLNLGWEHKGLLLESERDLIPTTGAVEDMAARSLIAATDEYVIDGTLVRNIDKLTEASLSLRFDRTDSLSLLGPGAGGPGDALRRDSRSENLTGSGSVNGMLGNWRWSVTGNYADADQRIFTDRLGGTRDRFDSSQQSFGANANISGSVIEGWAGPVRASITGGYSGLRFDSRAARGAAVTTTDLARDTPSMFGSLTIPLFDPEYDVGNFGRVSLTLNAEAERPSDFSALTSWGATLNWNITGNLSLLASFKNDEAAPSVTQLGAAPLVTPGVTYYDFGTGQTVQIATTTGGNPFLLAEQRRDLKLGLNWEAPMLDGLRLTIDYNRNNSYDTSNAFPLLTPEIEAAFPGRVTRDANGVLVALDQRPVNFDRASNSQIRWGANYGTSFGQKKAGGGGRGRGGRRSGGGRWSVSLYHSLKLSDEVLIRPGVPELDLLNGSATGSGGGSNRHLVEFDGGVFHDGLGVRMSAKYDSGSRVVGGANGDLEFGDLATFDLRFFVSFDQQPKLIAAAPFLKGSRLRLSIDNVFDAQRRITDASGAVPLNYQSGYIDPLGRYIELEWRKSF